MSSFWAPATRLRQGFGVAINGPCTILIPMKSRYDVVILGAGHNGLVAATYLGRAGLSVLLLEKNDYIGGGATSQQNFSGYHPPLSRDSYFVCPFPPKIIHYIGWKLVPSRLVFTDAKVGVFTHPHDSSLLQNRCFLYHLIGNKTGEWKVPVGGMGTVSSELERAARKAGAEMLTNVHIHALNVTGKTRMIEFHVNGKDETSRRGFSWLTLGEICWQSLRADSFSRIALMKDPFSRSTCS